MMNIRYRVTISLYNLLSSINSIIGVEVSNPVNTEKTPNINPEINDTIKSHVPISFALVNRNQGFRDTRLF